MAHCIVRGRHSVFRALQPLQRRQLVPLPLRSHLFKQTCRHASSTGSTNTTDSLLLSRLRVIFLSTSVAASVWVLYLYATDTRASLHRHLIPPLLRLLYPDAEDAHHAGTTALETLYALNLHPRERPLSSSSSGADPLKTSVFGVPLANPIGISAGLDKDARVPDALFALGAAVVEVGGVTPAPQQGNARPRVFRVPALDGLVNRYGLNSQGADAVANTLRARAAARLEGEREGKLLAVQLAKQARTDGKDVDAVAADYVYCASRLAPYADILVVNVSSQNTPGLRDLQAAEPLARILGAVVGEARRAERAPRVMVKVSPDEDDDGQLEGVVRAVWAAGVDGVIVGNTTKRRTGLIPQGANLTPSEHRALTEEGGFSGPAMFERTLDLVGRYRKMLDNYALRERENTEAVVAPVPAVDGTMSGQMAKPSGKDSERKVIFATGGIANGQQALRVLEAGASVAMVYTALVYGGSGTVTRIKDEMRSGMQSVRK